MTRAVRVIDLVTGLDMSAFHSLGGWDKMLSRLEIEVDKCRGDAPIILPSELVPVNRRDAGELQCIIILYMYMHCGKHVLAS